MNRAILVGRLTRDPELRYTHSGIGVASFTLAIDRRTAQGAEKEADFIPVVAWRQLAELCCNYLKKGQQAAVSGRIQTRNYENNEGRKIYVTEIIADEVQFLGSSTSQQNGQSSANQGQSENLSEAYKFFQDNGGPLDLSDDDLPF